jgi:hypothetical protein
MYSVQHYEFSFIFCGFEPYPIKSKNKIERIAVDIYLISPQK